MHVATIHIDKAELKKAIPVEQFYRDHLGEPTGPVADGWKFFCPFHPDKKTPNFVVRDDGRFKCFCCGVSGDVYEFHKKITGQSFQETLKTIAGKYATHLLHGNGNGKGNGSASRKIVQTYSYKDENGKLLYEAVRFEPKYFAQRQPDSNGGWKWNLKGVRRVLYRLPELIASEGPVYIPGGEKDCETLAKYGLTATSNVCGEGNWKADYNEFLKGRHVIILEDNDEAGRKHSKVISQALHGPAKSIKIVRFLELEKGGDVSDFLEGCSVDDLLKKVQDAPFYTPSPDQAESKTDEQEPDKDTWPEPDPIKTELPEIESFPFEILPDPLRPWVEDISYRMQCPPDFVATAAIVLCGSLIGTRCGIHPKQHDDWLVIPNLWGGVVGRPSTLKTPAISEALKPLSRLEAEAKKSYDSEIMKHEMDLLEFQAKKDALKADMRKAAGGNGKSNKSMDSIKEEMISLKEPAPPVLARYKTNDATVEKLSELLNENPTGLLEFCDELVRLFSTWEKPGRESDRAFFLESWNGNGSLTTDRIGRGTIFTKYLCLSLFGGIQPVKLTAYLYQSMNALDNDGLIQRLQLLVYPDEIKNWQLIDQAPDREARDRAYRIIEKLAGMDFTEYGAIREGSACPPYLRFSDSAQTVFNGVLIDKVSK